MTAIAQKTVYALTGINVLIIVGLRSSGAVIRELAKVEADCSADGITLNMFDSLSGACPESRGIWVTIHGEL